MERKSNTTFEEFKNRLVELHGEKILYRESGKHGWTSIEPAGNSIKLVPGNPGPHWCDASPIPSKGYLLGKYNFNSNTATYF